MRLELDYSVDMSKGVIGMKLFAEDVKDCIQLLDAIKHFPFLDLRTTQYEMFGYIDKPHTFDYSNIVKKMEKEE